MIEWNVYLAAPIDQAEDDGVIAETRRTLKQALEAVGATVFDPYNPDVGSMIGKSTVEVEEHRIANELGLEKADAVLAYLPDGVPSIGVPVEIDRALAMRKPIVALGGDALAFTPMWPQLLKYDIDVSPVYDLAIGKLQRKVIMARSAAISTPHSVQRPINVPTARPKEPTRAFVVGASEQLIFFQEVEAEIRRANNKHPYSDEHTSSRWFGIWLEEALEVVQDWNDMQNPEEATGGKSLETLVAELIQVGAMTQRFWQSICRDIEARPR